MKFQKDMLNFCDFIQVYVFTTNHHLNVSAMAEHSAMYAALLLENLITYMGLLFSFSFKDLLPC